MVNDDGDLLERRRKPRIMIPFPVTVRAVNASGTRFTTTAVIENLCCQGLSLRLEQPIEHAALLADIALVVFVASYVYHQTSVHVTSTFSGVS